MKKFKDFLDESYMDGAGLSSEKVPFDVDDSVVKQKVNAILGHTATVEFMNPLAALQQMESKLMQLGMTKLRSVGEMGVVQNEEFDDAGEMDLEFTRYESFGKTVDTPNDEFEESSKSYTLKVRYEKLETGSFKVYGSLV